MRKILFNVVIAVLISSATFAQWSTNTAVNNAIVTTSPGTAKASLVGASDGAGGLFIAWIDSRIAASQSIFVQRILPDGTPKFASEVEVTSSGNVAGGTNFQKLNLAMVADGSGGVIIVWQDPRNTTTTPSNTNNDIYGQRVDGNGNLLWTAGGKRMTVADNSVSNKTSPAIEMLNATEAVIVYPDNRSGNTDLYAQKISISNGSAVWATEISIHGNQPNTQTAQSLLADGSGGVFVVWQDPRLSTSNSDIYVQKIDNSGNLLWGASGSLVCNALNNQLAPQFVSDGSGGLVIAWGDLRTSATDANIYAQRVNSSGVTQWTANGELVNNATNNQTNVSIMRSGTKYIIAWGDNRTATTGDRNIYVQCIDNSGVLQWTPAGGTALDGIPVVTATGNQPSNVGSGQVMLDDGNGNAVLIWEDARLGSSLTDIYAQKIDINGNLLWPTANGVPICTAANSQLTPVAALSGSHSIITAWRDSRTASNGEIYASRIESSGVLPLHSIVLNASLRNGVTDLSWNTVQEVNASQHVVEKSADGVQFSAIGSAPAQGTGNGSYRFQDNKVLNGTNYYRIKTIDVNGAYSYSAVAAVQNNSTFNPSLHLYPNPVKSVLTVQLANIDQGDGVISVRDMSGRVLISRQITVSSAFQPVTVPVTELGAGVYTIEMRDRKGTAFTATFVKQ